MWTHGGTVWHSGSDVEKNKNNHKNIASLKKGEYMNVHASFALKTAAIKENCESDTVWL